MNIEEAFPKVEPGMIPVGNRVLIQIRQPKRKSKGGIILSDDTRDTEKDVTQIAKVINLGSLAYRNNTTMDHWPEGKWCDVGSFIRIPRYIGERWSVKFGAEPDDFVTFGIVRDTDVIGVVTVDPTEIVAYV